MRPTTTSLGLAVGAFPVAGGSVAEAQTGAAVALSDDIRPIFGRSCRNCHGEELSRLDLRSWDTAVSPVRRCPWFRTRLTLRP